MNTKNIAIRVDASPTIGTGHMMRCLTLASELKRRGVGLRFICREIPEHLAFAITSAGHELKRLAANSPFHQLSDAQNTIDALSDKKWDWLIVDSYALDIDWESRLRIKMRHIFVIDDIANRSHDCDILLDQNFYLNMSDRYNGKVPEQCRLLLGPKYALLRDEFRQLSASVVIRSDQVNRVLVFFGGVDTHNYTTLAIEALAESGRHDLIVHVVVGLQHVHLDAIKSLCERHGYLCEVQTTRMAELIANSDLAIGAGGSAAWEYCALALPMLIVITAENQRQLAVDLHSYGAAVLVGDHADFSIELFFRHVKQAITDSTLNSERSKRALSLFPDGPVGVSRTADIMMTDNT